MKATVNKSKRIVLSSIAGAVLISTFAAIITAAQYMNNPKNNPWDYSLLSNSGNIVLNNTSDSISVEGDIRSNNNIYLTGNDFYINGNVVTSGKIIENLRIVDIGQQFQNTDKIAVPNTWNSVYNKATENNDYEYISGSVIDNYSEFEHTAISESDLYIDISSETAPETDEIKDTGKGKIGVFGAGFLTSAYENLSKWETILPLFEADIILSSDSEGYKDLLELSDKSSFIPIQEQSVNSSWKNYERLPGAAITNNFSDDKLSEYINEVKQNNPVFDVGKSDTKEILGMYDNSSVNPFEAYTAECILISGGNCSLSGNFENIKEIKLDNWGGTQLIGDFPNLKYIYKTSWSNLNLAGNFPALECIYTPGGQLLLGTAEKGFSADNVTIINENGSIAVYTAQDTAITNSEVLSLQNILMRGSGKNETASKLNAENTLMAAKSNILFEDMNDCNLSRYENIPVFYSQNPISFVNCNFELMQGLFMTRSGAIIMAASDIDVFRGFIAAPNGINEYQANSAVGFYIDTYSYNIHPGINSLNAQPNGSEKIGSIRRAEYANFPTVLLSKVGNAEQFLNDIQSTEIDSDLGHMIGIPGLLTINDYLLSDGDININADQMVNFNGAKSVIGSKNGNITINILEDMNYHGVIYAPNGKVTINCRRGELYGRIFAKEIEIISDSYIVDGRNIDMEMLGFVEEEQQESSQPTESVSTDESISGTTTSVQQSTTESTVTTVSSASEESEESTVSTVQTSTSSVTTSTAVQSTIPVDYNTKAKYEYDNLNRVTKVIYDEKNYVIYDYDANGNITKVTVVKDGIIQQ